MLLIVAQSQTDPRQWSGTLRCNTPELLFWEINLEFDLARGPVLSEIVAGLQPLH